MISGLENVRLNVGSSDEDEITRLAGDMAKRTRCALTPDLCAEIRMIAEKVIAGRKLLVQDRVKAFVAKHGHEPHSGGSVALNISPFVYERRIECPIGVFATRSADVAGPQRAA